ncbi:MAG: DUF3883 domain-containing protein [Bacillota bacterium]
MLNELTKYNEIGRQKEIICFIKSILKGQQTSFRDIELLCIHGIGNISPKPDVLLVFFDFIGIIDIENTGKLVALNEKGLQLQNCGSNDQIIEKIIEYTIDKAFNEGILSENHFRFEDTNHSFVFKPEKMSLLYSAIRNLLIECEFLILRDTGYKNILEVNVKYEYLLTRNVSTRKRQISLEQLKEQLVRNEEIGEKAERYVLDYEAKRLFPNANAEKVKQISHIDVSAGYDIVSFNNDQSEVYDRYIEVKAIGSNCGFYWSKNEIQVAKLKGETYYLYLVDISKVDSYEYEPCIICDPANRLVGSDEWLFEAQSYYIRKV